MAAIADDLVLDLIVAAEIGDHNLDRINAEIAALKIDSVEQRGELLIRECIAEHLQVFANILEDLRALLIVMRINARLPLLVKKLLIARQIIHDRDGLLNDPPLLVDERAEARHVVSIVFARLQEPQELQILLLALLHGRRAQEQDILRRRAEAMEQRIGIPIAEMAVDLIHDNEIPCPLLVIIVQLRDRLHLNEMTVLDLPRRQVELEQHFTPPLLLERIRHEDQDMLVRSVRHIDRQNGECLDRLAHADLVGEHEAAGVLLQAAHDRVDLMRQEIDFAARQFFEPIDGILEEIHAARDDGTPHEPARVLELVGAQLNRRIDIAIRERRRNVALRYTPHILRRTHLNIV